MHIIDIDLRTKNLYMSNWLDLKENQRNQIRIIFYESKFKKIGSFLYRDGHKGFPKNSEFCPGGISFGRVDRFSSMVSSLELDDFDSNANRNCLQQRN